MCRRPRKTARRPRQSTARCCARLSMLQRSAEPRPAEASVWPALLLLLRALALACFWQVQTQALLCEASRRQPSQVKHSCSARHALTASLLMLTEATRAQRCSMLRLY